MTLMKRLRDMTVFTISLVLGLLHPHSAQAREYRLLDVAGSVFIRRAGETDYTRAYTGMVLFKGDRLRTESDGRAQIRCQNFSFWPLFSNQDQGVASGCPESFSTILRLGDREDNSLGGSDPIIPYLITPRRTTIFESQPLLKWNPVQGVNNYFVQVTGPGIDWTTEVTDSQVQYPGTPSLREGGTYTVIIEADNGLTSELDEGSELSSFTVIFPENERILSRGLSQFDGVELTEEARSLTLADLYISQRLLASAISELEPLVESESEIPQVYLELGDIYRYSGLNLLAEERYEQAIGKGSIYDDLGLVADARSSLAEVKLNLDKVDEAIELFEQAVLDYENLGNGLRVEEIQDRIDNITSPVGVLTPY